MEELSFKDAVDLYAYLRQVGGLSAGTLEDLEEAVRNFVFVVHTAAMEKGLV